MAVVLGEGRCRLDPFGDPYERIEAIERKVRDRQRVELFQQRDDVLDGAVLVLGEFGPERHRAACGLDRLLDWQGLDCGYCVFSEPACYADLTHGRLPLSGASDPNDHLAWETPYLVFRDP